MLSLQEISDRMEVENILVRYCNAIDFREFEKLDQVFAADAYIDYRPMGGIDGRYPQIRAWLPEALKNFPAYQHMISNIEINFKGDTATGRVLCFNPMEMPLENGKTQVGFLGLWYIDTYRRTAEGWRIASRTEQKSYAHNFPPSFPAA